MADEKDPFEGTRMSLAQHLEELRKRLLRGTIAVAVVFCVAWEFRDEIAKTMLWPLDRSVILLNRDEVEKYETFLKEHPDHARSEFFESDDPADKRLKHPVSSLPLITGPSEGFFFAFRNCLYAALFVGGPVLLWQMWGFIAAGLYQKERRMVMSYFPLSFLLFVAGVAMSFFLMVPYGIYYLQATLPATLAEFRPSLTEYLAFLSNTSLWAGLIFQMPIVIQVLIRLDFVQAKTFSRFRKHFIIASFLVSGIVTPSADPYSQTFMAVPMWLLYEIGILMGRWSVWRRDRGKPAESAA